MEQVTDSRADAFSDLLDIYEQIGRSQPSLSMYKELLVVGQDLTQTLAASYNDVIQVNKCLMLYFQQRRKISTINGFDIVLTITRLGRVVRDNLEAA